MASAPASSNKATPSHSAPATPIGSLHDAGPELHNLVSRWEPVRLGLQTDLGHRWPAAHRFLPDYTHARFPMPAGDHCLRLGYHRQAPALETLQTANTAPFVGSTLAECRQRQTGGIQ